MKRLSAEQCEGRVSLLIECIESIDTIEHDDPYPYEEEAKPWLRRKLQREIQYWLRREKLASTDTNVSASTTSPVNATRSVKTAKAR